MGRGGGKVLDFDPEDSSLGGHVNKKLWNHQALRLGVWGPFWGGGSNREQPFFSLALRLSTCVASRSATKNS